MEKLTRAQNKFSNSLKALERSIHFFKIKSSSASKEELENTLAALIKHFEICYEMSWKYLQAYLKYKNNIEVASPKAIFRESFAVLLITQEETKGLLAMAEARNATTHDYDEETAKEICNRISGYLDILKSLEQINI